MSERFESPLRIGMHTEFTAIAFGRPVVPPEVARLRMSMNEDLGAMMDALPAALATEQRAVLDAYSGGDFISLFYAPMWSFLHWVGGAELPRLRAAHAASLFLHLWDDHLSDGQLGLTITRLHVRSVAWDCFSRTVRDRCAETGQTAMFDEQIAHYLLSHASSAPVEDTDAYCRAFLRQAAIMTVVARVVGGADLHRVIERFATAWRLLDDINDAHLDVVAGAKTAVWLELDSAGRTAWNHCRERSLAVRGLHPESWFALAAAIRGCGALDRLLARIDRELHDAVRLAESREWHGLARELRESRVPAG